MVLTSKMILLLQEQIYRHAQDNSVMIQLKKGITFMWGY